MIGCVGDAPDHVDAVGSDSGVGVDATVTDADVASLADADADADADANGDRCLVPLLDSLRGAFCDDFLGPPIGAPIWSTGGTAQYVVDPTAPSAPGVLFTQLLEGDAGAKADITTSFPSGSPAVKCSVAVKTNLAPATTLRLLQIYHRKGTELTRTAAVVADTTNAEHKIGAYTAPVVGGVEVQSSATVGPVTKQPIDGWATIALALTPKHVTAQYDDTTLLDLDLPSSDPDNAILVIGLASIDKASTKESSARYDNVRCSFLPP